MKKTDRELLKTAMFHLISFQIARYLMANTAGRENGSEKASRHLEMSKVFVNVWTGDEENYDLVMAVHDNTQKMTNHMDTQINFDREIGAHDIGVIERFFNRFWDLAIEVLEAKPKEIVSDKVVCSVSLKEYEEAFPGGAETNQGHGCACFVNGDEVTCHYGSVVYDMEVYKIVAPDLGLDDGSVISDESMTQLIVEGKLRYEGSTV